MSLSSKPCGVNLLPVQLTGDISTEGYTVKSPMKLIELSAKSRMSGLRKRQQDESVAERPTNATVMELTSDEFLRSCLP
jgi:hypothetical protein